jgi:hypothetical protein
MPGLLESLALNPQTGVYNPDTGPKNYGYQHWPTISPEGEAYWRQVAQQSAGFRQGLNNMPGVLNPLALTSGFPNFTPNTAQQNQEFMYRSPAELANQATGGLLENFGNLTPEQIEQLKSIFSNLSPGMELLPSSPFVAPSSGSPGGGFSDTANISPRGEVLQTLGDGRTIVKGPFNAYGLFGPDGRPATDRAGNPLQPLPEDAGYRGPFGFW